MARYFTADEIARFWSHVDKSNECWLWTGAIRPDGYGVWNTRRFDQLRAHRVANELEYGPLADDVQINHHCDFRHCVRPSHTFRGTQFDNMADMTNKGRRAYGAKISHPSPQLARYHGAFKGSDNGQAKVTESDATAIRERYARESITQSALANEYGITKSTVSCIIRGKSWRHLANTPSSVPYRHWMRKPLAPSPLVTK